MGVSDFGSTYGMNGPASMRYLALDLFKSASLNIIHPTEGFKIIAPPWWEVNDATCYAYRDSSNVGMTDNGKPTVFPSASPFGASNLIWNLGQAFPSFMHGTYDVTFTPGLRWTLFADGGVTRTAYDEAAGTATIVIAGTPAGVLTITWTGYDDGSGFVARTLPPPEAQFFTIRPQGADPDAVLRTNGPTLTDLAPFGGGILRNMGLFSTNRDAITGVTYGWITPEMIPSLDDLTLSRGFGPPPELQFLFARAVGMQPMFNIHDRLTDEAKAAYARRIRDYRLPGEKVHVENSNENWNFGAAFMQTTVINDRARRSIAFNSGGPYEVQVGDTLTGATSGATGVVTFVKLNSGSWAGGDATGYIEIDPPTATGTWSSDPEGVGSENLNVGANSNVVTMVDMGVALTIQYARETGRLFDVFLAEFGDDAADLVFWVCWQFASGWGNFATILNEEDLYLKVAATNGIVAGAPYGGNAGNYLDTASIPKATRDLVLTDPEAYKDAYFAVLTQALATSRTQFHTWVNNKRAYCISKGLAPDAIRHGTYEHAPQHIIESNTPTTDNLRNLTRQAMYEMLRDPRMGVLAAQQMQFLIETGGEFVHFAYDYPGSAAQMQYGLWSVMDYPGETTDEPYAGLVTALSAVEKPAGGHSRIALML